MFHLQLPHVGITSWSFFKTSTGIFRTPFSQNTSIKLSLCFSQVGPAYGRKMMTGYVSKKHKVAIAEKELKLLYLWYLHDIQHKGEHRQQEP